MRRAIREHLRDFVAIGVLIILAVVTTGVILASQTTILPAWLPLLGEDRFELKAEFSSAQAVTPGQGQTVTIAGINVGQVSGSELESGRAIVTMQIDNKYAPLIHPDASLLLRPRTGLQDMTIEVDPGTAGQEVKEGSTLPLASSQPNVQPDQIFASLDGDTRSFLQLLLQGAAKGLEGNGPKLAAGLKRFEPFARDLARINGALANRRENIKRVITNFGLLSRELGHRDTRLAEFVRSSNDVLGSFAHQEANIRATLRELPGTLREMRGALASGDQFAQELGPASRALGGSRACVTGQRTCAAQALAPALREVRPLFRNTVGPIHNQIRPFARALQKPLLHAKQAATPLAKATTGLTKSFDELNRFFNALAYNPPGSAQEGYLFWLSWLNHDTNALFFTQDAGGPLRHGLVLESCATAIGALFVTGTLTRPDIPPNDPDLLALSLLSGVPTFDELAAIDPTDDCEPF
jgi:phospholipid/cholesterol/gamma-HCH transport system substrate-binding protein